MPGKRILLLYISQVSGHRSAAEAIQKAIAALSPKAQVLSIDAFNYTNPVWEKVINYLYIHVVSNAPGIWSYLYDNPAVVRRLAKIKKSVHKMNSPKLKKLFAEYQPDIIACTQAFPCGMVADFKKIFHADIPLVAVLTDFVPHSFWIYDNVDFYISPSEEVASRMQAKGVARQKIKVLGIPFDAKFNQPVDKSGVLRRLGLSAGLPTLLIMGGSHGLGPIRTIIESLEKLPGEIQEIIATGVNHRLWAALNKRIRRHRKKIVLLKYADNVQELMSISDILITKPGGITTAEALTKRIPMIIIRPIPGQEANNTDYLMRNAAAIKVDDLENIHLVVEDLLAHPEKLNLLREAAGRIAKPQAAADIAQLLLS